jgi:hypothetical protein
MDTPKKRSLSAEQKQTFRAVNHEFQPAKKKLTVAQLHHSASQQNNLFRINATLKGAYKEMKEQAELMEKRITTQGKYYLAGWPRVGDR